MSDPSFSTRAVVQRRRRIAAGVLRLVAALLLLWWTYDFVGKFGRELWMFRLGTSVFRTAQWASTVSLSAWVAIAVSLATWLLADSLRQALGLPVRYRSPRLKTFFYWRIGLAVPLLIWLGIWSSDEWLIRGKPWGPWAAMLLALAMCSMFAYDIPRLLRNAIHCIRSVSPLLRSLSELGQLPASGPVHTRGTVAAARGTIRSPHGECVYILRLPEPGTGDQETVESVPFLLECKGSSAWVDANPAVMIVEAEEMTVSPLGDTRLVVIPLGAEVHVVGQLVGGEAADSAYRGGMARICAGDGRLYVFDRSAAMIRRLLFSTCVELIAAAGMALCVLGVVVFFVYTGLLAM